MSTIAPVQSVHGRQLLAHHLSELKALEAHVYTLAHALRGEESIAGGMAPVADEIYMRLSELRVAMEMETPCQG